uniref:Microbial-type PARG catalytic domain-containing protein n=1 Tax=Ditylum brightwellii TaxID=49249 RepID=A0A7S4SKH9_9STRA
MTNFLNGSVGRVYLDTASPRVCIRGPEDLTKNDYYDIGYETLPEDSVFPFMELRAAAVDRRRCGQFISKKFNRKFLDDMRCRIIAQLVTLIDAGVRHVILSAFGCGAFRNPANNVAVIYREEIEKRATHFDVVVFAIFHAGYGPG